MILKLRNKKITIENIGTPECTASVPIVFDYELGTNHYKTHTTIMGITYVGSYITVPLDLHTSVLPIMVELLDDHDKVMRRYTGTFSYLKLCLIGTTDIFNIYEQLHQVSKELQELKEKGDVI